MESDEDYINFMTETHKFPNYFQLGAKDTIPINVWRTLENKLLDEKETLCDLNTLDQFRNINLHGCVQYNLGQIDEAEQLITEVVKKSEYTNINACTMLAIISYRKLDTVRAEELLQDLNKLSENQYNIYVAKAEIAFAYTRLEANFYEKAIKIFEEVTTRYPENFMWQFGLALIYRRCLRWSVRSIHPNLNMDSFYENANKLLLTIINSPDAEDMYKARSYIELADLYSLYGIPDNEKISLQCKITTVWKAVDIAPKCPSILMKAGKVMKLNKRYIQAERLLQRAYDIKPNSFICHQLGLLMKGRILKEARDEKRESKEWTSNCSKQHQQPPAYTESVPEKYSDHGQSKKPCSKSREKTYSGTRGFRRKTCADALKQSLVKKDQSQPNFIEKGHIPDKADQSLNNLNTIHRDSHTLSENERTPKRVPTNCLSKDGQREVRGGPTVLSADHLVITKQDQITTTALNHAEDLEEDFVQTELNISLPPTRVSVSSQYHPKVLEAHLGSMKINHTEELVPKKECLIFSDSNCHDVQTVESSSPTSKNESCLEVPQSIVKPVAPVQPENTQRFTPKSTELSPFAKEFVPKEQNLQQNRQDMFSHQPLSSDHMNPILNLKKSYTSPVKSMVSSSLPRDSTVHVTSLINSPKIKHWDEETSRKLEDCIRLFKKATELSEKRIMPAYYDWGLTLLHMTPYRCEEALEKFTHVLQNDNSRFLRYKCYEQAGICHEMMSELQHLERKKRENHFKNSMDMYRKAIKCWAYCQKINLHEFFNDPEKHCSSFKTIREIILGQGKFTGDKNMKDMAELYHLVQKYGKSLSLYQEVYDKFSECDDEDKDADVIQGIIKNHLKLKNFSGVLDFLMLLLCSKEAYRYRKFITDVITEVIKYAIDKRDAQLAESVLEFTRKPDSGYENDVIIIFDEKNSHAKEHGRQIQKWLTDFFKSALTVTSNSDKVPPNMLEMTSKLDILSNCKMAIFIIIEETASVEFTYLMDTALSSKLKDNYPLRQILPVSIKGVTIPDIFKCLKIFDYNGQDFEDAQNSFLHTFCERYLEC